MRKHTKAGLVLLMAGMMMAGSVTSAFADTEPQQQQAALLTLQKRTLRQAAREAPQLPQKTP